MSKWQPIETVPLNMVIDIWVSDKNHPECGARLTNVCKSSTYPYENGWVGVEKRYLTEPMQPTHWMSLPEPPKINLK